jgi:hypothetical protein
MRRYRKALAFILLITNLSGARVVSVASPCERPHNYFAPTSSFKAIAKIATKQSWRKSTTRSLGASTGRRSSQDMARLRSGKLFACAAVMPQAICSIPTTDYHNQLLRHDKLPIDLSPVQPPQLHSKK